MSEFLFLQIIALASIAFASTAPAKTDPAAYKFSYSTQESAQSEIGDPDGSVRGAYTYIDSTGAVHQVKYIAGHEIGFRVLEDKVDLTKATIDADFPLAHEIKLVGGYTPEVAAARSEHLRTFQTIKSLLPDLEEQEDVQIHHLRNEVPATVHRTLVPEIVHSANPPPVKSRSAAGHRVIHAQNVDPFIDGLKPEDAAEIEAQHAYTEAIKKLLPKLKEEGEVIIPVHHVHHVHYQGNIEAAPPKSSTHYVKVTTTPHEHIIEHSDPKIGTIQVPKARTLLKSGPELVAEEEKIEYPLASEIELIDGYTPEVYAERQAHLAQVAAIRAVLPEEENELA